MTGSVAPLDGISLGYWDTGGNGAPAVLLHAASSSMDAWAHQRAVLTAAGFRVIAYSRRGYRGSETGPLDRTGTGSEDLLALLDFLGISSCHLIGTAAGGLVATDFALSHPRRLRSLTLACTIVGLVDRQYLELGERLRPPGFTKMPLDFQELGPSYRVEQPEGVAEWMAMAQQSHLGSRLRQGTVNQLTWAAVRGMAVPTLMINGDADLWAPPAIQRLFLRHLPCAEGVVIRDAGHSAYWEQPDAFNAALVDFLQRH